MNIIWNGTGKPGSEDAPKPPQNREIYRNCGQVLGGLDELMPFIYVTQNGASSWELRQQRTASVVGLFAVGERADDVHRPGVAPHVGLILPVRVCRDKAARAALLEIPALLASDTHVSVADRRRAVQSRLAAAFGGDLMLVDGESLDGFFALVPTTNLFRRLHESFDYVVAMVDNPAGTAHVTATAPFYWRSYGELMEWHHNLRSTNQARSWVPLTPMLVCGNTAALPRYSSERWAESGLRRPAEDPAQWFVIRPGTPNAKIGVRLGMHQHGWARLHLSLDDRTTEIELSEVFDPFGELVAWGREIAEGDIPIQMEIDEEGREAVLTVLRTADPTRVLLRVTRKYENGISLEGIVARASLAKALRAELRRFFTTEFDPKHWDERDDDREDIGMPLRDQVLQNPWLADPG